MGNTRNPKSPKKRNGKKFYHQGFYKIINEEKYMGDTKKCIYRSSWELKFMMFLDHEKDIVRWGSETITIPYQDGEGKFHRYYPDIYIEKVNVKDPDILDKWVIEIKPYKEVNPGFINENGTIEPPERYIKKFTPTALESYEYQLKTYQKNLYKWTKAKYWCENNGMTFKIVTEKYLKKIGIL